MPVQEQSKDTLDTIIDDREALGDLLPEVKTPEDAAYLNQVGAELKGKHDLLRQMGESAMLKVLPDGSVADQNTLQRMHQEGQDASGPYDGGRR